MANAYKLGDGGSQGKTFGFIGIYWLLNQNTFNEDLSNLLNWLLTTNIFLLE